MRPPGRLIARSAARRVRLRPALAAVAIGLIAILVPSVVLAPGATMTPVVGERPGTATGGAIVGGALPSQRPSRTPQPPPAWAPTASRDEAARYRAAIDAALEVSEADGITVAVARDGELVWAGATGTGLDGSTRLTTDSRMVIGSLTKTFVATLILQLAEEGRLELDDPLEAHLPGLEIPDADVITLRQLLDHTSGLADVFNEQTRIGIETDPDHPWTSTEILGTLHAPWYPPGENWAYANTNYLLLGMVAEHAGAEPLTDALARRFSDPLELSDTRLLAPDDDEGPLAPAWTTIFWSSGAMESSAPDLARWGDALYRGTLLRPESARQMVSFNAYDHGLGAQRLEIDDLDGYGHTGLLDSYTSMLFHAPGEEVTIALLVNHDHADLEAILAAQPGGGPSILDLAVDERAAERRD